MNNGKYHTEDECEDARCPVHSKRGWTPKQPEVITQKCTDCPDKLRIYGYCERHFRIAVIEKAERERNHHRIEAEKLAARIARYNEDIKQAKRDLGIIDAPVVMQCFNGCGFKSTAPRAITAHQSLCSYKPGKGSASHGGPSKPREKAAPKVKRALTEADLF